MSFSVAAHGPMEKNMTNHHKPSYGNPASGGAPVHGNTAPQGIDLKRDRADKARVGGQHSNGGNPRRGEG